MMLAILEMIVVRVKRTPDLRNHRLIRPECGVQLAFHKKTESLIHSRRESLSMRFFPLTLSVILILAACICGCATPGESPAHQPVQTTMPASSSGSGTWSFIVFGDSIDPAANTTTGVSPALAPIARAIASEKPDLTLYVGDLINGGDLTNASPVQGNFSAQFANWEASVSPVYNFTTGTGIPIFMIRGNHESGFGPEAKPLLDAYRGSVAAGLPANGPAGEEKLSYSFSHKGAKFVATDDYIAHNGKIVTVNQSWVDGQLTQDKQPFIFVFGHSPAYLVDNDTEELPFSLPVHPAERDAFWTSMVNNNVSAYFCGHTHLYVRGERQGLAQIVSGNGGAPMLGFDPATADPAFVLRYPLFPITAADQKAGYLVVTVNENASTFSGVQKVLNATTGTWETGDEFTLKAR